MDNFNNLSVDELAKLAANALEEIESRQAERVKEVKKQIQELAASIEYSVSLTKLKDNAKKAGVTPVKAKYRNLVNAEQTWSGRGKRPLWVVAHLNNGGDISDLEI